MSRLSEEPVRSAAQRLADFEKAQALRMQLQVHLAAQFEVWRACERKSCRRSRRCTGPSVATCLSKWSRTHIDDATRAVLHAGVKARAAGASIEEACAVAEALAERIEAEHSALAAGKSWHEIALATRAEAGPAAPEPAAPPEPESEAGRAARIRALREAERGPKGLAHWVR